MRGPYILGIAIVGIIGYAIWFVEYIDVSALIYMPPSQRFSTLSPTAGYVAAFLACAGTFGNIALVLSWAGSNTGGDLKRSGMHAILLCSIVVNLAAAVVLAMVIGLGNLGGFSFFLSALLSAFELTNMSSVCSSFVFRPQDAPSYHPGHGTAIGCICITYADFVSLDYLLPNQNLDS